MRAARIQAATESFLTWRKRRKLTKKEKQKRKNPVLDWIEVILSAVVIVFLINQYFLQAYMIPSGSMEPTLLFDPTKDRIFVNKIVYGPELLPGLVKFGGFARPKRGEIVIFENPRYISKGTLFDIVHRFLYMLTFTLVDIDRDESGQPAHHFLIKRAVAVPGDRIRVIRGDMEFLPAGETEWVAEKDLKDRLGLEYPVQRLIDPEVYDAFETIFEADALTTAGLAPVVDASDARRQASGRYSDRYFRTMVSDRVYYQISPHVSRYGNEWRSRQLGWYIGENHIFPMGDNRDNSEDARYFHAVRMEKVLGRASFRFWPIPRLGGIR